MSTKRKTKVRRMRDEAMRGGMGKPREVGRKVTDRVGEQGYIHK